MSGRAPGDPPTEAERLARITLCHVGEPGDRRIAEMAAELGPETLLGALREQRDLGGAERDLALRLAATDPARDLEVAARVGARFVCPGDDEWPSSLDDLAGVEDLGDQGGAPIGLWVRGPVRLDQLDGSVAVVGSRSATTYGATLAADIAAVVGRTGVPVVSGAAFGIDQAAHRGALAVDAVTVAVLACGVDRVYPTAHRTLIDHLAAQHAVVSETVPGGAPLRPRFLGRNRLIAALTAGTVIVEAAVRSGALNTANWAGRLNRVVMGVPGPVTSAPSGGVHQLIRTGAATLVTGGHDVLEMIGASGEHLVEEPRAPERPRDRLPRDHRQVLEAVPVARGARVDSIARAAGLGVVRVQAVLSRLHQAGMVTHDDEGWRLAALAHG